MNLNQRAKFSYVGMMVLFGAVWVWAVVVQRDYDSYNPALDWGDEGFGRGWALYIFLQINL